MSNYIELGDFKQFLGRDVIDDDTVILELIGTASRWIDSKCGRRFYRDNPRAVADGATTINDATVTSASASFKQGDVGMSIAGTGIPASTIVAAVNSATSIELSANATATGTGVTITLTSTPRVYRPTTPYMVGIDDAVAVTAVATDTGDSGSYSAITSYQTYPLNGVGSNGAAGWPISYLMAVAGETFPTAHTYPSVRVTATWGWPAVPADIKTACYYYTHRLFYLRDTPGGTTMSVEFGAQPIRQIRDIESLIAPYTTTAASDGRFLVG